MLAKDPGHGKYLCSTMEEQCVVDLSFHHHGLLLLLTVYQDENPAPDTSKSGMYIRLSKMLSTLHRSRVFLKVLFGVASER